MHKAGFVNIIGNPNAGKSTLMNAMVGEKLSIITSKAQTTRHRIMGIVNGEDFQIVYSDTPGLLKPAYKLQESMMKFVSGALKDADVILLVVDVKDKQPIEDSVLRRLEKTSIPVLVLLNKIDLSNQESLVGIMDQWKQTLPKAEIFAVSALHNYNLDNVFKRILSLLPESPEYFPKDELTDKPQRFFVSEIIREKILLFYQKEIPYSVEVIVNTFKEEPSIIKIQADILVARESQKGIIIGHQGSMLKRTGTAARKDMESFLGKKVFLELQVKITKDWRDNETHLKRFGYE